MRHTLCLTDGTSRDEAVKSVEQKADGGSEQHRLLLGQYFLRIAETEEDGAGSAEQGVAWLIKAAKQGNAEAVAQLSTCLDTRQGRCILLFIPESLT